MNADSLVEPSKQQVNQRHVSEASLVVDRANLDLSGAASVVRNEHFVVLADSASAFNTGNCGLSLSPSDWQTLHKDLWLSPDKPLGVRHE